MQRKPMSAPKGWANNTESVEMIFPAAHHYLLLLGECIDALLNRLEGAEEQEPLRYAVHLAAHEACTNIIEHAYKGRTDGRVRVTLSLDLSAQPIQMSVDLFDTGVSFNPDTVPKPNLDIPHERGYGLFLIRELMDDVSFTMGQQGNHCRLLKHLG
jgi:serine/threonine-protein kinase RsbW